MHQTKQFRAALLGSIAGIGLIGLASSAQATTLALYDFESGPASTDTDAFSTASDMHYVPAHTRFETNALVGNPGSALPFDTRYSTIGEAKLHDEILTMTLAPAPGFAMNLYYLSTDLAARSLGSSNYIGQLSVFTSLDNYASPIHFNLATDTTASLNPYDRGAYSSVTSEGMLFNQGLYSNVTTPVEFRFYFFGTSFETELLDNVRISGTMAVAPEPVSATGVAAALLLTARRQRRAMRSGRLLA
jgi:hypothetical protein